MDTVAAREPVRAFVVAQIEVLCGSTADVQGDGPDAVHAARVASRRLRSTLRTYAPLWTKRHRELRADLRWYAGLLGAARDNEVLEDDLLELADRAGDPGRADARARIEAHLDADRDKAFARLRKAMDGARFRGLLVRLEALRGDGSWSDHAAVAADSLLPALTLAPVQAVRNLLAELPAPSHPGRDLGLHEARKEAKIARYAYEAMGQAGQDAAAIWRQVTEQLGLVQDGAVGVRLLTELEHRAAASGEETSIYARMRALEEARAHRAEGRALDAVRRGVEMAE